jgi:DNA modification methylase
MGSGTTAVAASLNNRKWIGFETEKEYIEVANKRLDAIELHNDLNELTK